MKWKDEYEKTIQSIYKLFIEWENQQIIKKKWKKKSNSKKKKKQKNGKFPVSGSPSWLGPLSRYNALPTELHNAVQCSTHWAAGNLPWKENKC